jgi:hypothetical protein
LVAGAQRHDVRPHSGSKRALLQWYAANLQFPDYFGDNWDALEESLRDLSWLPAGRIVLYHPQLPLPGTSQGTDRRTYVHLLADTARHWQRAGGRELIVAFDPVCEAALRALML